MLPTLPTSHDEILGQVPSGQAPLSQWRLARLVLRKHHFVHRTWQGLRQSLTAAGRTWVILPLIPTEFRGTALPTSRVVPELGIDFGYRLFVLAIDPRSRVIPNGPVPRLVPAALLLEVIEGILAVDPRVAQLFLTLLLISLSREKPIRAVRWLYRITSNEAASKPGADRNGNER